MRGRANGTGRGRGGRVKEEFLRKAHAGDRITREQKKVQEKYSCLNWRF